MKLKSKISLLALNLALLLVSLPICLYGQTAPAASVVGFPGAGALQAGDLWESLLPQAFGPFYSEAGTAGTSGSRQFIRFGNFDRAWTTPNSHWPGAFPWTMYWSHYMHVMEFNPDTCNVNSRRPTCARFNKSSTSWPIFCVPLRIRSKYRAACGSSCA